MKYIDLHTDALTKEGVLSVTKKTLKMGNCRLQCFACFTPHGNLADTLKLCDKYEKMCRRDGFFRVERAADMDRYINMECAAMLTVEGGEAIEGNVENLQILFRRGVRMLTLVWNFDNEIGTSHTSMASPLLGEAPAERVVGGGLTPFGWQVVERMGELGMIVDVSHGSDALFFDVAKWSRRTKIPFAASHSNARACRFHTRNLSDEEIRILADCGGVMGLNFYDEFLSPDRSEAGQREAIAAHVRHVLRVGGEDVLCFGSDFDGIPQNAYMKTAADMPKLIEMLSRRFSPRIAEKIAYKNAARLFRATLP